MMANIVHYNILFGGYILYIILNEIKLEQVGENKTNDADLNLKI